MKNNPFTLLDFNSNSKRPSNCCYISCGDKITKAYRLDDFDSTARNRKVLLVKMNDSNNLFYWNYCDSHFDITGTVAYRVGFPTIAPSKISNIEKIDFKSKLKDAYIKAIYSVIKKFIKERSIETEQEFFSKDLSKVELEIANRIKDDMMIQYGLILTKVNINTKIKYKEQSQDIDMIDLF